MILYGVSIIIFLFVSFSLFFKCACPGWVKLGGSLLILFASLKYVIYQLLGGAFFSPHLPRTFILAMEALYGALIVLCLLLFAWDLYLLGNKILAKTGFPVPGRLPAGIIKSGLVCLALGLGCWGTWQSIRVPDVKTVELAVADLPQGLDGFSIVQLSDLHIGPILKGAWLEQVVEKVNALNPDLIALTGDYIDGHIAELAEEVKPLADLQAKYGILGVTGNHEYYWNVTEWEEALEKLGVRLLNNRHEVLETEGGPLVVGGVPDAGAATRFGFDGPDIQKTFRNAPKAVRLLLSHQPKMAAEFLQEADIQLSGHTHGGIMAFLQPLVAHYNGGFVNGLYQVDAANLYVSPGTGLWNGFSCRIGVPAEITRIILKPGLANKAEADN